MSASEVQDRRSIGTAEDSLAALFAYREAMNAFQLDPSRSALLLVDLQYGSAHPDYGWLPIYRSAGYTDVADAYAMRISQVVLPSVKKLQAAFRALGAPVVFLTVGTLTGDLSDMTPRFQRAARYWRERGLTPPYAVPGSRDITVRDEIAPRPGEPVITKTRASGFTASSLDRVLWNLNVRQLVVCGVATNYCVESTLRDAADRGFDCVLVEDGCAATTDEIHVAGVKSMAPFCRISTAEEVVTELSEAVSSPVGSR